MTPLEQFNEEVKKELSNEIESWEGRDTKGYFDKFITQKLTAHKELILKMVREKAPKPRIVGYQTYCLTCNSHVTAKECDCVGFNQEMQEFLNNLDTI